MVLVLVRYVTYVLNVASVVRYHTIYTWIRYCILVFLGRSGIYLYTYMNMYTWSFPMFCWL